MNVGVQLTRSLAQAFLYTAPRAHRLTRARAALKGHAAHRSLFHVRVETSLPRLGNGPTRDVSTTHATHPAVD